MKIAVIHNGNHENVIHRFGQACPEHYSLKHVSLVSESLRAAGHEVAVIEGDVHIFESLRRALPADAASTAPGSAAPGGLVFNMAYGIQGDARYTHVPAMLEMCGFPYTGSTPLGHALALDKVITKILMVEAGVPTPAWKVMHAAGQSSAGLRFPLVVKPLHESTSYGLRLAHNQAELDDAVANIVTKYQQAALVEEYIDGREVCIGLLGNEPMEFLPTVELDFGNRELKLNTWDDKYHKRVDEPRKVCPAPIEDKFRDELNQLALATFRACHLRDYARVDIRIDPSGKPFVLEINSMASLGDGGSYITAAKTAGYTFASLVTRIVDVAHLRYFGTPAPREMAATGGPVKSLLSTALTTAV